MKITSPDLAGKRAYLTLPVPPPGASFTGKVPPIFTISTGGSIIAKEQIALADSSYMLLPYPVDVADDGCVTLTFFDAANECEIPDPSFCRHITLTAEPCDDGSLDSLRPLVHFTPKRGFMNDPNGLLYYNDKYYMFFQLNPYGLSHGNTHWGTAVSDDLLHWNELPPTLAPDETGFMFSGSGVVDYANTSGLQTDEHPPIVLFYTATGMRFRKPMKRDPETGRPIFPADMKREPTSQHAAVSTDGGKTFKKLGGNTLIEQIAPMNRDPKVVWCEDAGCWIMDLFITGNDYSLFVSDDLLHWTRSQTFSFDETSECPDIFEMPLDGDPSNKKWVIFGSPENYIVGHFEGREFIAETPLIKGCTQPESGKHKEFTSSALYAPQTFFGEPDGRIIQISWMPTIFPGMRFQSQMSLPWELKLVTTPLGPRITKMPSAECLTLRKNAISFPINNSELGPHTPDPLNAEACEFCFNAEFDSPDAGGFALSVRGALIVYDHASRRLTFPTGDYPVQFADDKSVDFRIICDRGSIELFACGGLFNCGLNASLDLSRKTCEVIYARGCTLSGEAFKLEL